MKQDFCRLLKIIIVTLNFCLGLFISAAAEEKVSLAKKEIFSLQDCIEIAKKHNPTIIQAKNELKQYELKVKQKYANYFPQVNLTSYIKQAKEAHEHYIDSYDHYIKIEQDLYTGGENSSLVENAKADLLEKQYDYQEIESDELLTVKESYYKILKQNWLIDVRKGIVERRKRNATLIQLLYNAGMEKQANLLRAESEIVKAELDLSKEEDNLQIYTLELNRAMGREISTPLTVEGVLQSVEFQRPLSELVNETKENWPELKQQHAKIIAAHAELKEARSGLLPTLGLETNLGIKDKRFAAYEDYWDAQLKLTVPVFDGFLAKSEVKEAEIEINNLQVEYDDLEKELTVAVNEAYLNLLNAQKQLQVSEQALRATQVRADLTQLEYKQGTVSYAVLEDDELDLADAELDLVDALYDVNLKMAQLDNSLGR